MKKLDLQQAQITDILKDYSDRILTTKAICSKYNISDGMLSRLVEEYHIERRTGKRNKRPDLGKVKKCKHCGKYILNDSIYCSYCGNIVKTDLELAIDKLEDITKYFVNIPKDIRDSYIAEINYIINLLEKYKEADK